VKLFFICYLRNQLQLEAEIAYLAGLCFLVHNGFTRAPVPKGEISAYHAAKMRKMCDALVSPENSAEQFKERVKNHEYNRWHRDWRNQQDDGAAWKKHAEGEQDSKIAPDAPTVG
jgi:hypothetical protein